jgi:hypothetical protein
MPAGRELCYYHARSRAIAEREQALMVASTSRQAARELQQAMEAEPELERCLCGGLLGAEYHELSLLHRMWLHRQGLAEKPNPSPASDVRGWR